MILRLKLYFRVLLCKQIAISTGEDDAEEEAGDIEILLHTDMQPTSAVDHMREVVQNAQTSSAAPPPVVIRERDNDPTLVHPSKEPFFYEKAFPRLYPYGHGGPAGSHDERGGFTKYIKRALMMGGDRRFQRCSDFIFTAYHYTLRRRLGGITYVAAREDPHTCAHPI